MEVKLKIVKSDGTLPPKTAKVAPINNILHSLWSNVSVFLNDTQIANTHDFGYRCYITNCLTYSSIIKSAQLSSQGYFADYNTHMDVQGKLIAVKFS